MTFASLFVVAIFAGIIDTISGGGGLLTVPALLSAGLPPTTALGTNRVQGCIGELTASWYFKRHRAFSFTALLPGLACTSLGAIGGTELTEHISTALMNKIIPWLMLTILIYSLTIKPKVTHHASLTWTQYTCLFGFVIGFYNGFFGPGTGSLWLMGFVILVGYNLQQASIYTKPFNCTGNIISAICFGLAGHVAFLTAITMGFGQVIGARLGAKLVLQKGHQLIKPLFIIVVSIMTTHLFLHYYT